MIIVEFQGGLGNQMFQYAFFEELKYKYPNETILVDNYDYGLRSYRKYELKKVFGIDVPRAKKIDVFCMTDKVPGNPYATAVRKRIEKRVWGDDYLKKIHKQYRYYSDSIMEEFDTRNDLYLSGWWQNENCFYDVRNVVMNKFHNSTISLANYIPEKEQKTTVSVHVRRGDYLLNPSLNILTMDYYKKALKYVNERIKNSFFVFFSEDPNYILENFAFIKNKTIIADNIGENSYKDMLLMSKCDHNIIANSTFSWWGAYLNRNPNKIVIAPSRYTSENITNLCSVDGWVQIEV